MSLMVVDYCIRQLRARIAAVRAGELDGGALSLEWVVIAIGLVAAAVVVGAFVMSWVKSEDAKITGP